MKKPKETLEPIEICFEECESCNWPFDIEVMHTDNDDNYFCPDCWTELTPVMKEEFEELIRIEFISVKDSYPEDYYQLLLTDSEKKQLKNRIAKTREVEIQYQDGHIEIGRRFQCKGDDYCWWGNDEEFDKESPLLITHWRPIRPLRIPSMDTQLDQSK